VPAAAARDFAGLTLRRAGSRKRKKARASVFTKPCRKDQLLPTVEATDGTGAARRRLSLPVGIDEPWSAPLIHNSFACRGVTIRLHAHTVPWNTISQDDEQLTVIGQENRRPRGHRTRWQSLKHRLRTMDLNIAALEGLRRRRRFMTTNPRPSVVRDEFGKQGSAASTHILRALELGAIDFVYQALHRGIDRTCKA